MIYIRAGVYAEGPTDYDFLLPLLDRLLDSIAAPLFPGAYEVGPTAGIDAPRGTAGGRAEKVVAAIDAHWNACTLFVIHADGAGDPEGARRNNVEPGLAAARSTRRDPSIPAAACVPVREIEAWMLVDPGVFHTILGAGATPACPAEPERELDPKATLRRILTEGGARRPPERMHAFFGERVRLDALRRLPAFQMFEADLLTALREIARLHGGA
jgi:hypothetical protein